MLKKRVRFSELVTVTMLVVNDSCDSDSESEYKNDSTETDMDIFDLEEVEDDIINFNSISLRSQTEEDELVECDNNENEDNSLTHDGDIVPTIHSAIHPSARGFKLDSHPTDLKNKILLHSPPPPLKSALKIAKVAMQQQQQQQQLKHSLSSRNFLITPPQSPPLSATSSSSSTATTAATTTIISGLKDCDCSTGCCSSLYSSADDSMKHDTIYSCSSQKRYQVCPKVVTIFNKNRHPFALDTIDEHGDTEVQLSSSGLQDMRQMDLTFPQLPSSALLTPSSRTRDSDHSACALNLNQDDLRAWIRPQMRSPPISPSLPSSLSSESLTSATGAIGASSMSSSLSSSSLHLRHHYPAIDTSDVVEKSFLFHVYDFIMLILQFTNIVVLFMLGGSRLVTRIYPDSALSR